jgi:hypothetical protein
MRGVSEMKDSNLDAHDEKTWLVVGLQPFTHNGGVQKENDK